MRLIAIVNSTPTGTIMPTSPEPRPVNINNASIKIMGVDALSKLLKKKSADGWTLISVVDDDGGKLMSSMGGGSEAQSLGSLGSGTFNQKEDRLVLIFGRPMK